MPKASKIPKAPTLKLVHTTEQGVKIFAIKGIKSKYDFKVRYKEPHPGARLRTPRHIHIFVDLLMKRAKKPHLVGKFLDHLVDHVCKEVKSCKSANPSLQIYKAKHAKQFSQIDKLGGYSAEFILTVVELVQTQEITNYKKGKGHYGLYQGLRNNHPLFGLINSAVGRKNFK